VRLISFVYRKPETEQPGSARVRASQSLLTPLECAKDLFALEPDRGKPNGSGVSPFLLENAVSLAYNVEAMAFGRRDGGWREASRLKPNVANPCGHRIGNNLRADMVYPSV
jgi:hypothetical protein